MPFEVPEGWAIISLEELAFFGGGKTPSMDVKEYWENGENIWVTSKDMKAEYISDSKMKITDKALEQMTVYNEGTLLIVTRSGILRHTLPVAVLREKACVNQDLKTISPFVASISEYLFWAIKANEQFILKEYHKDGTTVDSIDFDKFKKLPIFLPPLSEQARICKAIELFSQHINTIESSKLDLSTAIECAKSKILDLAIHGKLVPQDPEDEPAIKLLKRINPKFTPCDNGQYGKLPQGWAVCHLNDIADSLLGKTLDRSRNIGVQKKYLCALNVKWNDFDLSTQKVFLLEENEFDRYSVKNGDLLVCEGGDVGRAAIWGNNEEMYYQNALHRIRVHAGISNKFLLYQLMYLKRNGIIDDACKGVTIKHFTQNVMNSLDLFLPPTIEQHRIVMRIEELFVSLNTIQTSLETQ